MRRRRPSSTTSAGPASFRKRRPLLQHGAGAELVLAADQFIITPRVRPADEARLNAEGDEARTIIAGYPWFTDWGRDTMISLEGLTLLTGRQGEARSILHTFAQYVRDGLIPNLFPEGESEGLYHTADATLWFFHALDRYERATGETETRRFLMPKLIEIFEKHLAGHVLRHWRRSRGRAAPAGAGRLSAHLDGREGGRLGRHATPGQGGRDQRALLQRAQAAGGVAGRRGGGGEADRPGGVRAASAPPPAPRLQASFNRRFWNPTTGCLYDVVDGEPDAKGARDDASIRPNQVLAISLAAPGARSLALAAGR